MLKIRVQGTLLPFFKQKSKQIEHPVEAPAPIEQQPSDKLLGQYLLSFYILLIILFSLMAIVSTYAQSRSPGLKPGDKVPEVFWNQPINISGALQNKENLTLTTFKGKLIILDFWATWCAPCVAMMPRMDSLQKAFEEKVQFIPVTYQKEAEVLPFLEKLQKQQGRHYHLPEITGDTLLHRFFPHTYLPHYAWIDGQGVVKAITAFGSVTKAAIDSVLTGIRLTTEKKDPVKIRYDARQPLFHAESNKGKDSILIQSVFTGYKEGLSGGFYNDTRSTDVKDRHRITSYNESMVNLFQMAFGEKGILGWNRTVLEVKDPLLIYSKAHGAEYVNWLRNGHGYCYELILPKDMAGKALALMRNDLSNYFSRYQAALEKRTVNCLVLVKKGKGVPLKSAGGQPSAKIDLTGCRFVNYPWALDVLADQLSSVYLQKLNVPIVNETGYTGPADLQLNALLNDVSSINKALAAYGLELKQAKRKLQVLVIKDKF